MFGLINMIDWAVSLILFLVVCVFLMAQHNKNNVKLEPEEIERLTAILQDPDAPIQLRKQALKKLKAHQKALKERRSRQSKDQKKTKKTNKK